jgi:hypothetical protein
MKKANAAAAAAEEKKVDALKPAQDAPPAPPSPPQGAVPPAPFVPLRPDRWQLREHRNPGHWICVEPGTTLEQLLEPAFWANVARHLRPNVTVEVHWDDSSQFAELYVTSAGRNWAAVSLLRHHELARHAPVSQEAQFKVAWMGPVDKFAVIRLKDSAKIKAGFATEALAQAFLGQYLQQLAA